MARLAATDKQRRDLLVWKVMVVCDVLIFCLAALCAGLMLGNTCRLSGASNISGELQLFVWSSEDCSGAGETSSLHEPYPWAMLMSTLCCLYGKAVTHSIRWATMFIETDQTANCCERGCTAGSRGLLVVVRLLVSQACAVMLLLFTWLEYDSSLDALAVDVVPSLAVFQWAMIGIPAAIVLLLCCAGAAACGCGLEVDVNCDGGGDGMLGPGLCVGIVTVTALVVYGCSTLLGTLSAGGDLFRGLLLSAPPSLPPTSASLGFFSPTMVAMIALNIMQTVAVVLSYVVPPLAKRFQSQRRHSAALEGQHALNEVRT